MVTYTEKEIAPYLGLLVLMLEALGGEFTYSDEKLYEAAFGNYDKTIYQTRDKPSETTTIKLANAVHVDVADGDIEL